MLSCASRSLCRLPGAVVKAGHMLPRTFGWAQSALLVREETQARSRVLKAVTPIFASVYNLAVMQADGSGISDEQRAHNRSVVAAISEDFKFACSVIDLDTNKFKGKWLSPIVPRAAKAAWFKHDRAIGITQPQFQNALPNEAIALIFTAVSHEALLWSSGVRVINKKTKKFNLSYRFTYDKILGKLTSYEKRNTESWTAYRQKIIRDLRIAADGVEGADEDAQDEESDAESVEDDEDRELLDTASGRSG
ncbi:hypothetical protein PENSPDRAFT_473248 [Peniophora sp. CONT]|nr:hypothetical protein PENSPDRAFT_473248 [Peniophora sp. CONT]